ncbi:MAG: hypothetical protein AAGA68_26450 [Pseudomonadota bacterium]
MSITELGALGELLGAIGVIASLIYLAIQVRQNTRAMEESRRLALAQTYQMRADALQEMLVHAAQSEVGAIIVKLTKAGYPRDIKALDALTDEERGRFRQWQIAQQTHWDNMHFQYQQGFLDPEYYECAFRERVVRLAPTWRTLGLTSGRRSFFDAVREIEEEHKQAHNAEHLEEDLAD